MPYYTVTRIVLIRGLHGHVSAPVFLFLNGMYDGFFRLFFDLVLFVVVFVVLFCCLFVWCYFYY